MPKPLITIVTGIANGFAEQELLRGIIAENQKNGYSTVVFSNIYNIVQEDAYLECERRIYELVYSQDVSGVILFCESFVEERARRAVASMLQKVTVPVIGIGSELSEFAVLSIPRQNTDDVQEFEDLTDLPSDALPGYDRIYQDHVWMIRNKRSMYLRLIADWYDPDSAPDGLMQSRCILPWEDTSIFGNDRYDLQVLFDWEPGAAVCYYTTVFSGNRLFGDMAVLYDTTMCSGTG